MVISYEVGSRQETEPKLERKVYGIHETAEVPVRDLVCLPQVRKEENSEFAELKESIRSQGLMQPISVTKLTQTQLENYISFVNRIWHTKVTLGDYWHQRQEESTEDGESKEIFFYVVFAGHSRTKALLQIEKEDTQYELSTIVNMYNITAPEDIVAGQISENIHSQPARERRAMAMVETYNYGIAQGRWKNKADFIRKNKGKFSSHLLNEALGFADLPAEARNYVFSEELPYSVAVEIGHGADTLMQYAAKKRIEDQTKPYPTAEELDDSYRVETLLLIMHVKTERMNITKAREYIKARIEDMEKIIHPDGATQKALFSMAELEEAYTARLEREYQNAIRRMRDLSVESVVPAIELAEKLKDGDARAEHEKEYKERKEKFEVILGKLAVEEVALAA